MRPEHLKTRIFLDGGNPDETKEIIDGLGFLDGQTTNPTLISKNPGVRERLRERREVHQGGDSRLLPRRGEDDFGDDAARARSPWKYTPMPSRTQTNARPGEGDVYLDP